MAKSNGLPKPQSAPAIPYVRQDLGKGASIIRPAPNTPPPARLPPPFTPPRAPDTRRRR